MSAGKYRAEHNCLNCGHHVEEHFCTHCGQENIEVKEDALHMITHAVADYFHFESKFFGTIKPLLLKPGVLTKEYVSGKRVSFIHPIRLYIFISIVFFVVTLSSNKHEKQEEAEPKATSEQHAKTDTLSKEEIKELKEVMAKVPMSGKMRDSIVTAAVGKMKTEKKEQAGKKDKNFNSLWITSSDTSVAAYEAKQKLLPKEKRDNFLKHYAIRRTIELQKYPNAGERMKEDIMHNIPKMMFILLPLFAVILKLVYINKNKYYYENLIYSFHVHSAIFLSYLFLFALQKAIGLVVDLNEWLIFSWMLYILWYIYKSLKVFYGSRRWVTVAKILFLMFCYTIVFSISTLMVIAFTVIML
jgi:large-conductance mechanosensitive channel